MDFFFLLSVSICSVVDGKLDGLAAGVPSRGDPTKKVEKLGVNALARGAACETCVKFISVRVRSGLVWGDGQLDGLPKLIERGFFFSLG